MGKYDYLKPYRENPFFQKHLDHERAFNAGVPFESWARLVASEYNGEEGSRECPRCGGTAWYRALALNYTCVDCGDMFSVSGMEPLGKSLSDLVKIAVDSRTYRRPSDDAEITFTKDSFGRYLVTISDTTVTFGYRRDEAWAVVQTFMNN